MLNEIIIPVLIIILAMVVGLILGPEDDQKFK
jgi:hypothetical protein